MKIIRDEYVNIIDGDKLVVENNAEKITQFLVQKVQEELKEIVDANYADPSEYGDLIQVVLDLGFANGISEEDINQARLSKFSKLGGFTKGIFLKGT